MLQPKVSVILPSLNVAEFIRECVESVIAQTMRDIEIICVDAGSTDGTLEILNGYAANDARVRVINSGRKSYGYQMNIGIDAASGEYIGIVETDDYIAPQMYEELYGIAAANRLDFVKSDFYRFTHNSSGERKLERASIDRTYKNYNKLLCPREDPQCIRFTLNTWTGIYRREFLKKYNIRHNETAGASYQDNGFYFQTFAFAERAMIVDRAYYYNRRDNPNSSVASREKIYCMNIEYDFIRDVLKRDPAVWERFKNMYWWKKYHNYNFTLRRIGKEYKEEYVSRFGMEYKRALQLGELNKNDFNEHEWGQIMAIIRDGKRYYRRYVDVPGWVRRVWRLLPERLRVFIKQIIWRG